MRHATWLRPVIGLVAAIAVGVGAAFIAVRFAPVAVAEAPIALVEASVLEPVADDAPFPDAENGEQDNGDAGGAEPSTPVVVDVSDPDRLPEATVAPSALPADLEAALAEASALIDPYFALIGLLPRLSTPFGDPCAIDPASPGCPPGVRGVVLEGELPPLAATIEYGVCPAATGTNLSVAVRTNTPAEIAVTFRSGSIVEERATNTDAETAAGWAPDGPARALWHCVSAEGWERGATVDVRADITDVFGRSFTVNRALTVPVSAGAVRPDAQILGLSGNLVQVSIPFAEGQTTAIRWVDSLDADCTITSPGIAAGGSVAITRPESVSPIPADYIADNNWLSEYNQRSTAVFAVTPGSSYRVCVGWYDAGPADASGRPQYRNEVVVHAPATSFPTVTLTEVRLDGAGPEREVSIRASVPASRCGAWGGPEAELPAVVCDLSALSSWVDANGYVTITTEVATDAAPAINHHLIEASALNCPGGCDARRESFDVPLLSARPGLCGSDCAPQETLGWARLSVSWPSTVGRQWWELGETVTGPYTELAGDRPNMETASARWILGADYDPVAGTQGASFPLTTDRPVTVSASLVGDCYRTAEAPVYRNDEMQQWSGALITFPELCMGTNHAATIVLTDEDGDVSTYAFARGDTRFWPYATFSTQGVVVDLPVRVNLTAPDGEFWALGGSQLTLGGEGGRSTVVSTPGVNIRRCFSQSGSTVGYRMNSVTVGSSNRLDVRLTVRQTSFLSDVISPDGFRDCALLPGAEYQQIHFAIDMPLDDLLGGSLVTYTDPTTGIVVELRPEPTLFR